MRALNEIQAINEQANGLGVWDGDSDELNVYWFDVTGKVHARSIEQAERLLTRYSRIFEGMYVGVKVTEVNIEAGPNESA